MVKIVTGDDIRANLNKYPDFTAKKLADKVGVSAGWISKLMQGKADVSEELSAKIEKVFSAMETEMGAKATHTTAPHVPEPVPTPAPPVAAVPTEEPRKRSDYGNMTDAQLGSRFRTEGKPLIEELARRGYELKIDYAEAVGGAREVFDLRFQRQAEV